MSEKAQEVLIVSSVLLVRSRYGNGLFDRDNAKSILLLSPVDGSGVGDSHLGAADEQRYVGRVSVAVADETCGIFGGIHRRLRTERPYSTHCWRIRAIV